MHDRKRADTRAMCQAVTPFPTHRRCKPNCNDSRKRPTNVIHNHSLQPNSQESNGLLEVMEPQSATDSKSDRSIFLSLGGIGTGIALCSSQPKLIVVSIGRSNSIVVGPAGDWGECRKSRSLAALASTNYIRHWFVPVPLSLT